MEEMSASSLLPSADRRPVLVSYDISDNRRRNSLYRLLHSYGEPMHRSLFLCWLNPRQLKQLQGRLDEFAARKHHGEERIACIEARPGGPLTHPQSTDDWIF